MSWHRCFDVRLSCFFSEGPGERTDSLRVYGSSDRDNARVDIHLPFQSLTLFLLLPKRSRTDSCLSSLAKPFTGVVYLAGNGITQDFQTLIGKRIGCKSRDNEIL